MAEGAAGVLTGQEATPAAPVVAPAGGGEPTPAADHWTATIEDQDLRGFAQNKGFKDVGAVLESYRNLEKLQGLPPERLLKLPKDDTPEAWAEVYDKLGRPETAEGYKLPVPEGGDDTFAKQAATWFHEAGLTPKQAETLAAKWNEHTTGIVTQHEEAAQTAATQALETLKTKWGPAYDQNARIVDRAAQVFGMEEDQLLGLKAALGPAGAMEFLFNIGMRLGEDKFVSGDQPGGFVMTPEAARARIVELTKDTDFFKRLQANDVQARGEWERLHKMASPGMQTHDLGEMPGAPPRA